MLSCFTKVKNVSEKEKKALVFWLYNLCNEETSFMNKDEYQVLYMELVKGFGLEAHSTKVISSMVQMAKKIGKLTPVKKSEYYHHSFDYAGPLPVNFEEDQDIYDRCGRWKTTTLDEINLVRLVFCNSQNFFQKVLVYTFFCPENKKLRTFRIPEEPVDVPEEYKEAARDYSAVKVFSDAFKLSEDESVLLNFIYLSHAVRELNDACKTYLNDEEVPFTTMYGKALGKTEREIRFLTRGDKKLQSFGILNEKAGIDPDAMESICANDVNAYFSDVLKEDSDKEIYELDSYMIKEEETELAVRLLQNQGSINLLLYGSAGAGKTQYARSLVQKAGLKAYVFKNELEVSECSENGNRALKRLNSLLSLNKKDSVIIVDEAESVLSTGGMDPLSMIFGGGHSSTKKGTVNTMLENSENKVIWILNYTDPLDESTLRRFNFSVRFNEMSSSMMKTIAGTKLDKISMEQNLKNQLVNLCGKFRVTGASVDNVVKTISGMDLAKTPEKRVVDDVKKVLEANSALIFGKSKMRDTVNDSYDLEILNTSTPAEKIVRMIENAQGYAEKHGKNTRNSGIRLCFYGVSGTGKTELARYIAEKLNKKIILKRASDIFGRYVGDNEKNIREAFEEAEASNDVLLFDEADSFFTDRNLATVGWERTMVNEFLTQMEEFNGILICTTNLRKIMDPAMQRRFHILCEFKPLDETGIRKLLDSFFGDWEIPENKIQELCSYRTVTPGDFGTLSSKIRFMDEDEITGSLIIDELCKIQEEKEPERHIGFAC